MSTAMLAGTLASRGASGGPLPSNEDMGSKMPNCLRTAMKRMMTTPMANSSMPWIPMTSGHGGGVAPLRVKPAREGLARGRDEQEAWAGPSKAGPGKSTTSVFNRSNQDSGWWVSAWVCFQAQEDSMRARPASWMKANVNTDAEVENMWKLTYMENLPL